MSNARLAKKIRAAVDDHEAYGLLVERLHKTMWTGIQLGLIVGMGIGILVARHV